MNLAVDGNNSFHTGWLCRFLGLPKRHPIASAIREGDLAAFEDGWEVCDETIGPGVLAGGGLAYSAFLGMLEKGQVVTYWQDDDGNEVPT